MNTQTNAQRALVDGVRRIASLEYALIEACHAEPAESWEYAQRIARAGVAQVHLFDLGTALREMGDDSLSYSRCVRHALLESGTYADVMIRIQREYTRVLARKNIPDGLRVLLRTNELEHVELTPTRQQHPVAAAA